MRFPYYCLPDEGRNNTSETLPKGLVRVGHCAFLGCAQLKPPALPTGMQEVGEDICMHSIL
ncbi:MAG: hypothetical protein Q4F00_07220 [bacterium]|nr:hypothetical protein [bacterium]